MNIFNQKDSFRVVTGRRKEERYMVSGIACTECDKYYKTMNIENNDLCDCSSRHRSNAPLRRYEKNNFTQ